jgi:hypothetical protein
MSEFLRLLMGQPAPYGAYALWTVTATRLLPLLTVTVLAAYLLPNQFESGPEADLGLPELVLLFVGLGPLLETAMFAAMLSVVGRIFGDDVLAVGRKAILIFVSLAVVFGLLHDGGVVRKILVAFTGAVFLAVIWQHWLEARKWYGFWVCYLLHGVFNLIVLIEWNYNLLGWMV